MKRNVKAILLVFSMLFVLLPFAQETSADSLDDIRQIIRDLYIDDVPEAVLERSTANGIMDYLDPHSIYMSAKDYQGFINRLEQRVVGIGVVLEEDLKGVRVTSVISKGPAERAGIQPGDVITHVDQRSMAGQSMETAASWIGGAADTTVEVTIERPGQAKSLVMRMTRELMSMASVESTMLGGNIGYIGLNSFATDSAKEMNEAIRSLKGAKGWIVDLRNNGGGYTTAAQEVMGFLPNAGGAFQLREKNSDPVNYQAITQPTKLVGPRHLLINASSASASEMVAAAVKEQKLATLYGQTSYGKGTMQSMFEFEDGSVLKLTTARFYSPGGQAVDKVGVKPNVVTAKGAELEVSHRAQLIGQLKGYRQLPKLEHVPITKTFTVKMDSTMSWDTFDKSAVQLIQLGGKENEVAIEVKDDQSVTVVPQQALVSGEHYVLIVHPRWRGTNHQLMRQGIYVDVTVK
ncbi:S41 family peptidase [Sporosarcina sp. NPDC096371]|uniref:S41 family peptidase n=1 Tax=Sporosarcina sp. NPDC096371 TaxID=3364530 RepID=UPI00381C3ECF